MAQDPDQKPKEDDSADPQYPYGTSPQEPREAPPSYASPQFYETAQPINPSGSSNQQPNSVAPQNMYAPPPGYAAPPHYPYSPPPQYQYGAPSGYGHGAPPHYPYGAPPGYSIPPNFAFVPQSSPLPLGEAIKGLPSQYWRVLTRPSSTTFAREMGKASWNIVWVQLVFYTLCITLLGYLSALATRADTATTTATGTSTLPPETIALIRQLMPIAYAIGTYGQIIIAPLSIFVSMGILFLLAKAFGGSGKFLPQLYTSLLFLVPLGIIVTIVVLPLALLPAGGSTIAFLLGLGRLAYEGVLLGLMLMPVHSISGGRAAGAVLLLFGIGLLLACILGFVFAIIITASLRTY